MLTPLFTTKLTSYRSDGLNQLSQYLENVQNVVYTQNGIGKRPYMQDKRPFLDVLTAKNLTLQVLKSAIVPLNLIVSEYNIHTVASLEKEEEEEEEEFDWSASYNKHSSKFLPTLCKSVSVSIIRKALESVAEVHFSAKVVDRLTKDLYKSMRRKVARSSGRFAVAQKVFWTSLHGSLCFNLSCLLYDLGLYFLLPVQEKGQIQGLVEEGQIREGEEGEEVEGGRCVALSLPRRVQINSLYVGKKCVYYAVCLTSSALGASLGSLINIPHGGGAGSLLFELLASIAVSVVLKI
jgi:hypothetical protein